MAASAAETSAGIGWVEAEGGAAVLAEDGDGDATGAELEGVGAAPAGVEEFCAGADAEARAKSTIKSAERDTKEPQFTVYSMSVYEWTFVTPSAAKTRPEPACDGQLGRGARHPS